LAIFSDLASSGRFENKFALRDGQEEERAKQD
jgi:hypothetical protein